MIRDRDCVLISFRLLLEVNKIKERNVLFNDALNTCLRLYGIGHVVKEHLDSERKPAAATSWAMQGIFYMHHSKDRMAHVTVIAIPVVAHWMGREIAQWVPSSHHEWTLPRGVYVSLSKENGERDVAQR